MSYIVLARKYRPKTFEEVVGQEHVATTLRNAIRTNRLAHAYLFTGPRGVGKTTMARILAKSLNCEKGPTETPCNKCSICVEITDSRSMDVFEIDGASNRVIDEIRNLRENVRYSPAKGRYKIYIIDEVHMLTTEAFNALLKTLEEPPKHVLFIFATTEPQKVISTILSRCQRFDFRRLRIQELIDRIHSIAREEGIEIEKEASRLIALKADGSMRDGESMLDQLSSYTEGKVGVEDVRKVLGFFDPELLFDLTNTILNQDGTSSLAFLDNLISGGIDEREFLPEWIEYLRTLLHTQLDLHTDRVASLTDEERNRYREQAARVDTEKLLRMIQMVSDTENQMRRSDHPRVLLESCIIRMSRLDSTVHLKDLLERIKKLESQESPGSHQSAPNLEDIETLRKNLFERIPKSKKGLSTCLNAGEPSFLNGHSLLITFPKERSFEKEQVEEKKNRDLLEGILKEILGRSIRIECILDEKKGSTLVERASEVFEADAL